MVFTTEGFFEVAVESLLTPKFVQPLQFCRLFSVKFHCRYCLRQSPRLFWFKLSLFAFKKCSWNFGGISFPNIKTYFTSAFPTMWSYLFLKKRKYFSTYLVIFQSIIWSKWAGAAYWIFTSRHTQKNRYLLFDFPNACVCVRFTSFTTLYRGARTWALTFSSQRSYMIMVSIW